MPSSASLTEHFASLPDPRIERTKRHKLIAILVIAICALICGAETFVEMATFGRLKADWLGQRLQLPNGIPSHDTFNRVFRLIDPQALAGCFLSWVQAVRERLSLSKQEHYALDGKTSRRTFTNPASNDALHMVSVWAVEARLVVGQRAVDHKSNEITAVPQLLKMLDLAGCIVTMDAMHCQKENTRLIVEREGDYVLALKGNQGGLQEAVQGFFESSQTADIPDYVYHRHQEIDQGHGRTETRAYTLVDVSDQDRQWLDPQHQWAGLHGIGMVESERRIGSKTTQQTRYFITSLAGDAARFGGAVRRHWSIENRLHWVLDIAFNEDQCRARKDHAPANLAILRHIALNLLKQERTARCGVKARRLSAGWDNHYLGQVLAI